MVDPAYMSAFAALVGTFVGGVTSIATSWLGQQRQTKRAREKVELQALYKQFIQSASRLYVDALEHNTAEIPKLVDIYTTLNRIRVLSLRKVIEEADQAVRMIVDTYAKENTTFSGVTHSISKGLIASREIITDPVCSPQPSGVVGWKCRRLTLQRKLRQRGR